MPPAALDAAAPQWRWPPLLTASAGLHALAAGAAVAVPGAEPWALSAVAANHVVISATGLIPRSAGLGPNLRRLPAAAAARGALALTFDDGPDPEVTPRVLDQLDAAGARASFFVIAAKARRHAALVRELIARGHDVQNHSARHSHRFSLMGPKAIEREVADAQAAIEDIAGRRPHCFRAPAGLRNPFLDPVLHRQNLHLTSWTRRGFDTRARDPGPVLARLERGLAAGDILLLHDGHAARAAACGTPVTLAVLPRLLERIAAAGLRSVTLADAVPPRHAGATA